jgi:hypothetical protein
MPDHVQENKPRGPMALDGLIKTFLRENHLTAGGVHLAIFQAWQEVTESNGTRHTQAVLYRQGHLTVEVASAALLQELRNFTGENFRIKVNERFQKEVVRKITFKIKG